MDLLRLGHTTFFQLSRNLKGPRRLYRTHFYRKSFEARVTIVPLPHDRLHSLEYEVRLPFARFLHCSRSTVGSTTYQPESVIHPCNHLYQVSLSDGSRSFPQTETPNREPHT